MTDYSEERARLFGSLLTFTQVFYKLRTNRDFELTNPVNRESHIITVCRELTKVFNLETNRILINIPPGHFKSTMLQHFIAWAMAQYPDSNFLYISYSAELATKHTTAIREIMSLPLYRRVFGVELRSDSAAKDHFVTTKGGSVMAFGSSGSITGQDAGLPFLDRFSGAVVMDDMHKPDEVFSETLLQGVIDNFNNTIKYRRRGEKVPFIFLGQRLRQGDLPDFFIHEKDGYCWTKVILKSLDEQGNALAPSIMSKESLEIEYKINRYAFAAQHQQEPLPAGGGIFDDDWWVILEQEPLILDTFLTCDTAETDKNYNDATVFSFWGIYKIMHGFTDSGVYGLHWLDCHEVRVEPKDLQSEFFDFYYRCMTHKVKPNVVAIEKKSTGVTLSSVLKSIQGMQIMDIQRTAASGNKVARYRSIQPLIASRRVSFTDNSKHQKMCIEHMSRITDNNTHRHDDIADTLYDAVKISLIDEIVLRRTQSIYQNSDIISEFAAHARMIQQAKTRLYS